MIKKTGLMLMLTGMNFTLFAPKTVRQDFASYPVARNNNTTLRESAIACLKRRRAGFTREQIAELVDAYNPEGRSTGYVNLMQKDGSALTIVIAKYAGHLLEKKN